MSQIIIICTKKYQTFRRRIKLVEGLDENENFFFFPSSLEKVAFSHMKIHIRQQGNCTLKSNQSQNSNKSTLILIFLKTSRHKIIRCTRENWQSHVQENSCDTLCKSRNFIAHLAWVKAYGIRLPVTAASDLSYFRCI